MNDTSLHLELGTWKIVLAELNVLCCTTIKKISEILIMVEISLILGVSLAND